MQVASAIDRSIPQILTVVGVCSLFLTGARQNGLFRDRSGTRLSLINWLDQKADPRIDESVEIEASHPGMFSDGLCFSVSGAEHGVAFHLITAGNSRPGHASENLIKLPISSRQRSL